MQNNKSEEEKKESISILGCGWLGFPLALYLISEKYKVKGSSTTSSKLSELNKHGIEPHFIDLHNDNRELSGFLNSEILIINIPPRLQKQTIDNHLSQIRAILTECKKHRPEQIIFISSTSLYPEKNKVMNENDADESHDLKKVENLILDFCQQTETTFLILRCGGLMGYDRIPCKYYAGKKGLTIGETPVNYIHRDDVIGIISELLTQKIRNEIINVVAPLHPNRQEVFEKCCEKTGIAKAEFVKNEEPETYKIISSEKLQNLISYKFKYPDPCNFQYNSN